MKELSLDEQIAMVDKDIKDIKAKMSSLRQQLEKKTMLRDSLAKDKELAKYDELKEVLKSRNQTVDGLIKGMKHEHDDGQNNG